MKKNIIYTPHLRLRMKIRKIENNLPQQVYEKAKEKYFNSKTGYCIAVSEANYKGKIREIAVIYEETTDEIKLITIYPLKYYEKISKVKSGRWKKSEKIIFS